MSADNRSDERPSLDLIRVAALGRDHFGFEDPVTTGLPGAAVATADGRGIAVVTDPTTTVVGGVLLWAEQSPVSLEAIVVDGRGGVVDRWLDGFVDRPSVHELDGRDLVEPAPADEERIPVAPAVPSAFDAADVDVVIENGMVVAEVDGLEVARVVVDDDGTERVEIGVGQYDRAAHEVMTAGRSLDERLAAVAGRIRAARRPQSSAHGINRLCRERWLRSALVADPGAVGLVELAPVDPVPRRTGLLDASPAPAVGSDGRGARVLVMASTGVDPGLAVSASAVARREAPDRIVVALPPRDIIGPVERLLARLRWPVEVSGVHPPWA